jgi:hypothetical protein
MNLANVKRSRRHSRESGNPGPQTGTAALDPRFRDAFAGATGNVNPIGRYRHEP